MEVLSLPGRAGIGDTQSYQGHRKPLFVQSVARTQHSLFKRRCVWICSSWGRCSGR
jgi:hypothetical protein